MGSPPPEVTTAAPKELVPECNIESGTVSTYDGKNLEVNLCSHVLAQDKINKDWAVAGGCRDNSFMITLKKLVYRDDDDDDNAQSFCVGSANELL